MSEWLRQSELAVLNFLRGSVVVVAQCSVRLYLLSLFFTFDFSEYRNVQFQKYRTGRIARSPS